MNVYKYISRFKKNFVLKMLHVINLDTVFSFYVFTYCFKCSQVMETKKNSLIMLFMYNLFLLELGLKIVEIHQPENVPKKNITSTRLDTVESIKLGAYRSP